MKQALPKLQPYLFVYPFYFKTNAQTVQLHGKIIDSTTRQLLEQRYGFFRQTNRSFQCGRKLLRLMQIKAKTLL